MDDKDEQINELTRQGKNICTGCNQPKEMYYVPYCTICDAPKLETVAIINYIQVLRYIRRTQSADIEDELHRYMVENHEFRNDSYFTYHIQNTSKAEKLLNYSKGLIALDDYLISVGVEPDTSIVFWVSW